MSKPIRIVVADDHAVLRAGLMALLNDEPDMEVVGEASDGAAALRVVQAVRPDVVLLDINMPGMNGLEALEGLRRTAPDSRVLVLTMHDDETYLRQVLASGGSGYVLKQAADKELLSAIRTVHSGGTFLHPAHAQALLAPPGSQQPAAGAQEQQLAQLSEREREVLRLIALGYSNKEIAEMLFLSVKTVETYKARVMEKLGLTTRAALVRFALQHGLLDDSKT
ncbi:MAG TPA: response regulator transcription factor [Caldilineaceae bacterium]|nr:response regulator transcription factor [Caldilineaceae bacterium]